MRAFVWASLVTMPDWEPVKLTAGTPRALRAIESSAIEMRSPAESSMSSSRRAGLSVSFLARARSSSVVSPIADTTTTTSLPAAFVVATRSATLRILSTSATEEPPYFWTTMATLAPPARGPLYSRPARPGERMLCSIRGRSQGKAGHLAEHRLRRSELAAPLRLAPLVLFRPASRPGMDRDPHVDDPGRRRHQGRRPLHARPGALELQVPVVALDGPIPVAHPRPQARVDPARPGRAARPRPVAGRRAAEPGHGLGDRGDIPGDRLCRRHPGHRLRRLHRRGPAEGGAGSGGRGPRRALPRGHVHLGRTGHHADRELVVGGGQRVAGCSLRPPAARHGEGARAGVAARAAAHA